MSLDLGGAPVQHREIQDCESELLMSYFDKIMVQAGGIDSGFKKVKPEEYRTRLLHVKGTKNRVTIREVPKTYKSLNSGDVFVLDGGKNIYQWNGKASNGTERHRAAELCRTLDGERKGLAKITVFSKDAPSFFNI
jgi:gelsolin